MALNAASEGESEVGTELEHLRGQAVVRRDHTEAHLRAAIATLREALSESEQQMEHQLAAAIVQARAPDGTNSYARDSIRPLKSSRPASNRSLPATRLTSPLAPPLPSSVLTRSLRKCPSGSPMADAREARTHQLSVENTRLRKRQAELVNAFKKQNQLIDVLKRQKLHAEEAVLLEIGETEFKRTLQLQLGDGMNSISLG